MEVGSTFVATCFMCGESLGSGFVEQAGRSEPHIDNQDEATTNLFEERSLMSLCQILRIPSGHPAAHVLLSTVSKKMNCSACNHHIRNLDSSLQTIKKLQQQILSVRQLMVEKLLTKSANIDRNKTADGKQSSKRSSNYSSDNKQIGSVKQLLVEKILAKFPNLNQKETAVGKQSLTSSSNDSNDNNKKDFFVLLDKVLEEQSTWTKVDFLCKAPNDEVRSSFEEPLNEDIKIKIEVDSPEEESKQFLVLEQPARSPQWFSPPTDPLEFPAHFLHADFNEQMSQSNNIFENMEDSDPEDTVSKNDSESSTEEDEGTNKTNTNKRPKFRRKKRFDGDEEGSDKSVKCKDCGKLCNDKYALKRHEDVHLKQEHLKTKVSCSFCGIWRPKGELESHESQHRQRHQPFSCLFCANSDVKFLGVTQLKFHMKEIHPGEVGSMNNLQKYKCKFCAEEFLLRKSRDDHLREIHGDLSKHHSCDLCGKVFTEKYLVALHKKNMHTSRLQYLTLHQPVDADELKFKCTTCDKGFKCNRSLKKHEKIHAGLEFKCPDCPKVFRTQRYLQQHGKVHLAAEQKKYYKPK